MNAQLGLASTRELLEELKARAITTESYTDKTLLGSLPEALLRNLGRDALNYRTVEPKEGN